jgi:hypothetical protein
MSQAWDKQIIAYSIVAGKSEWARPLGRTRHRWKDINTIDSEELGRDSLDSTHIAQDGDQRWTPVNMAGRSFTS